MKKNIKFIASLVFMSICFTFSEGSKYPVFANTEESKIDLLIDNKKEQDNLQKKMSELEQEIYSNNEILSNIESKSNMESSVVTVSFIRDEDVSRNDILTYKDSIENQIATLTKNKKEIEKQLENYMIEGVKLEKFLEEEKQSYLKENKVQYIQGMWPLQSYTAISSPFGNRIHPISGIYKFHKGVDIPAPKNTDILASDDGIVIFSGIQNGYGNVVKIKHFDGKETVYAHATCNLVQNGDIVKKGQPIAKVGSTGNSTGNHLHFETIVKNENINPLTAVNK